MDKYYTPELEEFYYGFKYYYREYEKSKYVDCIFGDINDTDLNDIIEEINDGKIKVKYLDKEDIESLGWKLHKEIPHYYKSSCDNFVLRINFKDLLRIYVYDDYTIDKLIFEGTIKNKSELKKLFKMLNID